MHQDTSKSMKIPLRSSPGPLPTLGAATILLFLCLVGHLQTQNASFSESNPSFESSFKGEFENHSPRP